MVALSNRDDLEARLTRLLGKAGREATELITSALGDPPDANKLTPELLKQLEDTYSGALLAELERVFVAGAEALIEDVGVGVDWALINQAAADWSRQYTYNLVRGISDNSRQFLQQSVSDFYSTGMTNAQLSERIARLFGAQRAESISITEVTRAAVEGERAMVAEIERAGLRMVAVWHSVEDDRVCPICSPRDGKKYGDGWNNYPPAHPRCRCFVSHEPVEA